MKEDYTKNDFLTLQQWNQLIGHLRSLELATRVVAAVASVTSVTVPSTQMTAQTFNDTETLTQALRERIAYMFRQKAALGYAGDPIYASTVPDNYTRGI